MEEIWKDVIGYEDKYQISSLGRVKALSRISKRWHGDVILKEKILKPRKNNRGYYEVLLHINGKGENFLIHRLVAKSFVVNPYGYTEINHKDEDKSNNNASNIEWCTRKYNINYGSRTEKQKLTVNKKNYASRLKRVSSSKD